MLACRGVLQPGMEGLAPGCADVAVGLGSSAKVVEGKGFVENV